MHLSIDKKKKFLLYIIFFILLSSINSKNNNSQNFFLTRIENINVRGLSDSKNLEIENKLNNILFKNIFFINKESIHSVISKYNLVENYQVKKIYPKTIQLNIKKTIFVAQIKKEKIFLIGSNGKTVEKQNLKKELPFFFGQFDSRKFLEFKNKIDESKFKFEDFQSLTFFPSKRWDLKTVDGILIKLPNQNLSEVLIIAYKALKNNELKNNRVIDLRISNHIIANK